MLSTKQAKRLLNIALSHAGGRVDGIEASISTDDEGNSGIIRFANNEITEAQSATDIEMSVRVIVDGNRQTRQITTQIAAANIRQLVDKAIALAHEVDPDPKMPPLYKPRGKGPRRVNHFDPKTARMGPMDRANQVRKIIQVAEKAGLSTAGIYSTSSGMEAIANSNGVWAANSETEVECSMTMIGQDSSGWAKMERASADQIDVQAMAEIAAHKALSSAHPIEIKPGRYTVILEPSAVVDLMCFLWDHFSATNFADQYSCLLGKLGKKVFGKNITIYDDCFHPEQTGAAFDDEGVPRRPVTLVRNGVPKHLLYSRRSAIKSGVRPTGHGLAEPGSEEMALNLVMQGGNTSLEEMIQTTKRGILMTRIWYARDVDPLGVVITGMSRDGTFLIQNGKIVSGIKNMRFNVNLLQMLNHVVALSPAHNTTGEETPFGCVVPAMKVKNFPFTAVTTY